MTAIRAVNGGDRSQREASTIVLEALDEHDDFDWETMDSTLYDFVDTDALNSVFTHDGNAEISVQFDVEEVTVTVWQSDTELYSRVSEREE